MKEHIIITISRQYGSGGRIIGKRLAEALGISFYDNELIALSAEKSGIAQKYFAEAESVPVGNLLLSLSTLTPGVGMNEVYGLPLNEKVYLVQSQIIKDLADKESCVIVGRCADYILQSYPNCINVFIHAAMNDRIERVVNVYKMPQKNIENMILKTDKRRANYYSYFTNQKWGRIENYELVLDSSKIGIDNAVEIIKLYVQLKEKALNQ